MANFTKKAIYDSFLKFLDEKPLDQIKVKDIVEDCGINRKTFYYYFQDLYALADEIFRERFEELKEDFSEKSNTWFDTLSAIASYMFENRKLALHVYHSMGFEKIFDFFDNTCMAYLPEYIMSKVSFPLTDKEELHMLSSCLSTAISGILARWLRDGMKTLPMDLISGFAKILDGAIQSVSVTHEAPCVQK